MSTKKKLVCFLFALLCAVSVFVGLRVSAQAAQLYHYHDVVKGDTLWKLSKYYSVSISDIVESNPAITNPDLIYIGQRIAIPLDYQADAGSASENSGQNGNDSTNTTSSDIYVEECLNQINQVRAKNGLSPLTLNNQLNAIALERCKEMNSTGVFSHTLPYSGTPFEHMKANGITYWKAGENIASGFSTSQVTSLVNAWVASPGHYANIVGDYNQCGLAYYNGYWCNLFIKN